MERFNPIDPLYAEMREKYGSLYPADASETCHEAQYSCPNCGASDRCRLYALYFRQQMGRESHSNSSKIRLLDIAPSRPLTAFLRRQKQLTVRTADLERKDVDDTVDITNMALYDNETFDAFICSHVLEHVPDDRKAIAELFRILKPSGWGILMVPINLAVTEIDEDSTVTDVGERWRRFGQHDHVRRYSKAGFIERVQQGGFALEQLDVKHFGKKAFTRHGIALSSVLYVVHKSK